MFRLTRIIVAVALAGCASASGRSGSPNGGASLPQSPVLSPQSLSGTGTLVVVGGGPIPDVINRRFVDLAGGAGKARIVVLPMASESGAESGAAKAADYG